MGTLATDSPPDCFLHVMTTDIMTTDIMTTEEARWGWEAGVAILPWITQEELKLSTFYT